VNVAGVISDAACLHQPYCRPICRSIELTNQPITARTLTPSCLGNRAQI